MATIPARTPYNFTHTTTDLTISIEGSLTGTSGSTIIYDIIKTSYDPLVAVPLTVNLSPFASDIFEHAPSDGVPITIEPSPIGEQVDLVITGNITAPETFDSYDGWVSYSAGTIGLSSMTTVRNLVLGSKQYITGNLQYTKSITYMVDNNYINSVQNPDHGTCMSSIFPVIHSGSTISDSSKELKVRGYDINDDLLWTVTYNFVCPFEDVYTIGFLNRYGVWEFVDMVGSKKDGITVSRKKYMRHDTGVSQTFNTNGFGSFDVNTGWVDEDFKQVVNDLLLSDYIVHYTGDLSTSTLLSIDDTQKTIQTGRKDKMINYQFKFTESKPIISIV